jgi:superfamily I DNA/RNA helicase
VAVDTSKLNPPQRAAVIHGGGPLLVLAGAGSGKTRVITYRIAHLLDLGIPPDAIAALTFTNKAAEEMRERIAHLLGDHKVASKLTMGTFHALGLRILRAERKALGYPGGFAVYDASDQLGVLREVMREVKDFTGDGERRYDVKAILSRISLAKNAFVDPEAYQPRDADEYDHITATVYPRYQAALRSYAAFDFDDLIVEPVRLMGRDREVRERWQTRFRFVLVDEYQDTNKAQVNLVRELVTRHHNLTVVGDDDQSIYAWRGADPGQHPGLRRRVRRRDHRVKLEQNYRSTKTILDAANAVIANNKDRHGKTLWSEHGAGELITHAVAPDVETESKWVAQEIRRLKDAGRKWQDIAILYRSNMQAKPLEEELRQLGVPYAMYGGQEFFERKEVKDVIAYLRVALNPRDELSLRRIVNYPARGIGPTTLERILRAAHAQHATLLDALRVLGGSAQVALPVDITDDGGPDDDDDDDEDPYERGPAAARGGCGAGRGRRRGGADGGRDAGQRRLDVPRRRRHPARHAHRDRRAGRDHRPRGRRAGCAATPSSRPPAAPRRHRALRRSARGGALGHRRPAPHRQRREPDHLARQVRRQARPRRQGAGRVPAHAVARGQRRVRADRRQASS